LSSRLRFEPRSLWKMGLGLVLGLVLFAWMAHGVPVGEVWARLVTAQPVWVGLASLSVLVNTAAKVARWRELFPEPQRPGISSLMRSLLIGQMANALLPARLGDVLRAHILGSEQGTGTVLVLGTIAAEKAFDILGLLVCAGLTVVWTALPTWLYIPLIALAGTGLALFSLALACPEKTMLPRMERWAATRSWQGWTWLVAKSRALLAGLVSVRQPRRAVGACSWSVVVWASATATNYLLLLAYGLHPPLIGAALLLLVTLTMGIVPPSSPAKLGVFHSIVILTLAVFGVDRSAGLVYAVALHLLVYVPQIVPGAILLGWVLSAASRFGPKWRQGSGSR
jgi:glycosyltransferase 2 family protein